VQPLVGQTIQFASNATDPDNDDLDHLWSFGGGVTSTLRNPTHPYSTPGTKTVTLRVTDSSDVSHTSTRQVVVSPLPVLLPTPNQVPIANFAFGPRTPRVGDPVEFVSTAVDPDGEVRELTWDLDGDGQFDDARGSEVVYTYLTPGEKQVRLRVEDAAASAAVQQRAVTVLPAPTPPPGFLRPSPKVRLNGLILTRGMRVRILGVQAPRGAIVTVRCKGKPCPVGQRRKRVKRSSVRFRSFERFLRGGVRLEIYVRKAKTIGSYTRYTIRAGKGPRIIDRCLPVGASTKPKRRCG
jgi:hypothetical protein